MRIWHKATQMNPWVMTQDALQNLLEIAHVKTPISQQLNSKTTNIAISAKHTALVIFNV